MAAKLNSDDEKWRAESDLSTLIEAQKIRGDKVRFSKALKARDQKLSEMQKIGKGDK